MTGAEFYAYVLRLGFKRTDKSTEFYEATTDAIEEMRRRFMFDESEKELTTTDTIAVDGDFKVTVESDFGLLLGVTIQDGTNAFELEQKTKSEFNELYPDINVTNDRGYPKHFCIFGGNIHIGPIPDAVTYTYRLIYSIVAGTVTTDTASVPFTNVYRDVLADNVLYRLYKGLGNMELAGVHRQSFEEGFLQATRRDRNNSGVSTFVMKPLDV